MSPLVHRRLARRRFLRGAAGLLAGAAATTAIRRSPALARPISGEAGKPLAFLSTSTVAQGKAFSLHVDSTVAAGGTVTFNQRAYQLYNAGDYLVTMLGAGQLATDEIEIAIGNYTVLVDALAADGGSLTIELALAVVPTDFPVDQVDLSPSTSALLDPSLVNAEFAALKKAYTPQGTQQLWQGLFQWPVVGPITTNFGQARSYNGGPVSGHHSGVDIGVDLGTPVSAAAAGRISFTGPLSERGNMVIVEHGLGVFTGYAHLSEIDVSVGDLVAPGSIIGKAGSTGLSTGPHVHWECAVNGVNVDASQWTRVLFP